MIVICGQVATWFFSGIGGGVALIWEFNFPYSPDPGYVIALIVFTGLEWAGIWWLGERLAIRGRPVRYLLLIPWGVVLAASCYLQYILLVAKHS